jgi:hypothetical protein
MAFNPDPMNISGPTQPAPYQQPNTANPSPNSAVASTAVGNDVMTLNLVKPPAPYVQPGISSGYPF